ncbi:MAG: hypothetical protein ABI868_20520 [Acidobacteriota bacterium]
MTPRVDIHIVSFRNDLEWCRYAIRSVRKYATGFGGVTLVVPASDAALFAGMADRLVTFRQRRWRGFLHHMIMVHRADQACPDADFVVHMDSDCLFVAPVTPADYVRGGRAVMMRESFDQIRTAYTGRFRSGAARFQWQEVAERVLGFAVDYETMVRHPSVHPRALYAEVRRHIERTHGMPFDDYVFSCGRRHRYTEFPVLGAYALKTQPDRYEWIDARSPHEDFDMEKAIGVREKMRQFPGRLGIKRFRAEVERILA